MRIRARIAPGLLVGLAAFGAGWNPSGPALAADRGGLPPGSRAYVVNDDDATVSVIDLETFQVAGPGIPIGSSPRSLVLSPDGSRLYVSSRDADEISVVSTQSASVTAVIPVSGLSPFDLAVTPDGGRVYVACKDSATVSVIDTVALEETTSIALSSVSAEPRGLAITPDGTRVYVVNRGSEDVDRIDTSIDALVGPPVKVNKKPRSAAISPDGSRLLVVGDRAPTLIDIATDTVVGTALQDIGTQRTAVIVGTTAYVPNYQHAVTGAGSVDVYDTAVGSLVRSIAIGGARPSSIALDTVTGYGWVACQGSNEVREVDLVSGLETGANLPVGRAPGRIVALIPGSSPIDPFLAPLAVAFQRGQGGRDRLRLRLLLNEPDRRATHAGPLAIGLNGVTVGVTGLAPSPRNRNLLVGSGQGTRVRLRRGVARTSRALLSVDVQGDLADAVDRNGTLTITLASTELELDTAVVLRAGRFSLRKGVGTVRTAVLVPIRVRGVIVGDGFSTLTLRGAVPVDGSLPAAAADVTLRVGSFEQTIPAADLTAGSGRIAFSSRNPGIRTLIIDTRSGTLLLRVARAALGNPQTGPLELRLTVGGVTLGATVGMVRAGRTLRY